MSVSALLSKYKNSGKIDSLKPVSPTIPRITLDLSEFQRNNVNNINAESSSLSAGSGFEPLGEGEEIALCLCFIIIDEFPHEILWRSWLNRLSSDMKLKISIIIHAKFPGRVRSIWVKERLVPFNLKPEWGSKELTAVMLKLLKHVTILYSQ